TRFPHHSCAAPRHPPSFPTRRSSDLRQVAQGRGFRQHLVGTDQQGKWNAAVCRVLELLAEPVQVVPHFGSDARRAQFARRADGRSEEHTSELQSRSDLVCRLLLEKKN